MRKIGVILGIVMVFMLSMGYVNAYIFPNYLFGMVGSSLVHMNSSLTSSMAIHSFHATSETWLLQIKSGRTDDVPYDRVEFRVTCDGNTATFNTTDYSLWNLYGFVQIPMEYASETEEISYNNVTFDSQVSLCDFTILDWNFTNNTVNYTYMEVNMIPYIASIEIVDCTGYESSTAIQISESISITASLMEDAWDIIWLVYSIVMIIFAIIGIPLFVFIIIRWAIARLTGYKLIERRER